MESTYFALKGKFSKVQVTVMQEFEVEVQQHQVFVMLSGSRLAWGVLTSQRLEAVALPSQQHCHLIVKDCDTITAGNEEM